MPVDKTAKVKQAAPSTKSTEKKPEPAKKAAAPASTSSTKAAKPAVKAGPAKVNGATKPAAKPAAKAVSPTTKVTPAKKSSAPPAVASASQKTTTTSPSAYVPKWNLDPRSALHNLYTTENNVFLQAHIELRAQLFELATKAAELDVSSSDNLKAFTERFNQLIGAIEGNVKKEQDIIYAALEKKSAGSSAPLKQATNKNVSSFEELKTIFKYLSDTEDQDEKRGWARALSRKVNIYISETLVYFDQKEEEFAEVIRKNFTLPQIKELSAGKEPSQPEKPKTEQRAETKDDKKEAGKEEKKESKQEEPKTETAQQQQTSDSAAAQTQDTEPKTESVPKNDQEKKEDSNAQQQQQQQGQQQQATPAQQAAPPVDASENESSNNAEQAVAATPAPSEAPSEDNQAQAN